MGICPDCGSWVDDGDICMECGGRGSYSDDDEWDYPTYPSSYSPQIFHLHTPYDKAETLFKMGRYLEAISALEGEEDTYEIWELRGDIYLKMGEKNSAINCYDNALEDIDTVSKSEYVSQETLAKIVASKMIALMKFGKMSQAISLYKEYAYIKKSQYPTYDSDRRSRQYREFYPRIRKCFEERKSYFHFDDLKLPEIDIPEPPKPPSFWDIFR